MTDVLVTPAFLPSSSLDSGDTSKLGPIAWKASRLFTGGGNARDLCMRDGASATGASWVAPSVAVTKSDIGLSLVENTKLSTYVVPVALGGTNLTGYAVGDLLYASGATTLAKLADVATGSVLISGGVTTAPAWSASPTLTSVKGATGANLSLGGNNATPWIFDSNNHFYPDGADNTYDAGAASKRIRTGYFGTALVVGTNPAMVGIIRVPHGNGLGPLLMGRNSANNADIDLIRWGYTADTLELGLSSNVSPTGLFGSRIPIAGLTASFPALKRDTIFLQLRLGDDSGVSGAVTASLPAAAAGRDGIIGFDTTLNAFVYYVGGSRFKLVGTAF